MPKKTKQQPDHTTVFYLTTPITITKHADSGLVDYRGFPKLDAYEYTVPAGAELHFIRDEFVPFHGWFKVYKVVGEEQWLRLTDEQVSQSMPEVQP